MSPLRILITNHALADRAGSELYVRDLAGALMERGHRPVVYSPVLGPLADDLRRATVPVVDHPRALGEAPDVIHGQHNLEAMTAMLWFPDTPAIFCCHGVLPWEEAPPCFPRVLRYIAVDEVCRERIVQQHGVAPHRVQVLLNFVDLARFHARAALPRLPRRALLLSNEDGRHVAVVREACAQRDIELEVVGRDFGNSHPAPEVLLPQFDLVFAKARCALEAMAAGTAVILAAAVGMGRLVTTADVDRLRPLNFGIRALRQPFDVAALVAEIDRYDPDDATEVSRRIRATAGLDGTVERLLSIYREVIAEWAASGQGGPGGESRAAAAYLSWLSPQFKAFAAQQRSLQGRLGALERDHGQLRQACAASEAERTTLQEALASTLDRLRETGEQQEALRASLSAAEDTIHHMERSRFWKARSAWRALAGVFR